MRALANCGVKARRIDETSLLPSGGLPGLCDHNFLSLHRVKCRICLAQEALNRIAVLRIDGNADADGKLWSLAVIGSAFTDTSCHYVGRLCVSLRQDQSKLIPAEARRSIDVPATGAQNIGHAAKRLTSSHMSVTVVD